MSGATGSARQQAFCLASSIACCDLTRSPDSRAAQRHKQLRRIGQALRSRARKPQPGLCQTALRVDHIQDPGITGGKAAAREIERGCGCGFGLAFGTKVIGVVCECL